MANYAYLDKQGILRIVASEATAKEYAKFNGKVTTTTLPNANGTPTMFNKAAKVTDEVFVYDVGKAYFEPRERADKELKLKDYPELWEIFGLYRSLQ